MVEINAPRLSSFHFDGALVKISVVDPSPLRDVYFKSSRPSRMLSYARTRLPSITRNVSSLTLVSSHEVCIGFLQVILYKHIKWMVMIQ